MRILGKLAVAAGATAVILLAAPVANAAPGNTDGLGVGSLNEALDKVTGALTGGVAGGAAGGLTGGAAGGLTGGAAGGLLSQLVQVSGVPVVSAPGGSGGSGS
ncbi:hypothetical protein [Saccharothrix deserti]|uniref:hypothetical protein n=1 Tax=Saccharothrix deserti TaxID=2593674 RepID=UPI00131C1428|nr:hypothetical protein [Saccharothrix deserti]